jgi:hypothetical protein
VRNEGELIARAAARAAKRREYLGWVLDRYVDLEGLRKPELAKRLNLAAVQFARLALCLRPRQQTFASDVEAICREFSLEPQYLAEVVRMVESVDTMSISVTASTDSGVLMAARSREKKPQAQRKTQQDDKRTKS